MFTVVVDPSAQPRPRGQQCLVGDLRMRRRHRHEAGRRVVLQHVRGAGVPVGGQFVERNPTSGDPVLVDVDHREQHASRDLLLVRGQLSVHLLRCLLDRTADAPGREVVAHGHPPTVGLFPGREQRVGEQGQITGCRRPRRGYGVVEEHVDEVGLDLDIGDARWSDDDLAQLLTLHRRNHQLGVLQRLGHPRHDASVEIGTQHPDGDDVGARRLRGVENPRDRLLAHVVGVLRPHLLELVDHEQRGPVGVLVRGQLVHRGVEGRQRVVARRHHRAPPTGERPLVDDLCKQTRTDERRLSDTRHSDNHHTARHIAGFAIGAARRDDEIDESGHEDVAPEEVAIVGSVERRESAVRGVGPCASTAGPPRAALDGLPPGGNIVGLRDTADAENPLEHLTARAGRGVLPREPTGDGPQ